MPAYRKPFEGSGAAIFETPEQFFAVLFGPQQHDWHIQQFRVRQQDMARIVEPRIKTMPGSSLDLFFKRHGV